MYKLCAEIITIFILLSPQCQSQNTSTLLIDATATAESTTATSSEGIIFTTEPSSTASLVETSIETTATSNRNVSTTVSYICRTSLNTSPNLSPFWVTTVLLSVPNATNVGSCFWRDQMETKLLTLLTIARAQSSNSRRKRAAESGQLGLQLVSATRSTSSDRVSLVYYALLSGNYLSASSVVASLSSVSSIAASTLGYSVSSLAATYEDEATTTKLWLLGAMFGSLAGILLVTWAVLFIYQKCLRPHEGDKRSLDTVVDEFYTDRAMANIPDMRANPRIGFSKADIGTIADEVAKHLDAHMTDLVQPGLGDSGHRSMRPGNVSEVREDDESIEVDGELVVRPASSIPAQGAPSSADNLDGNRERREQSHRQSWKRKEDSTSDDVEEVDETLAPAATAAVEQQAMPDPARRRSDACGDNSFPLIGTQTKDERGVQGSAAPSFLPMDSLPLTTDMESSLATSRAKALAASSPYRTGDEIAKIRPMLEADLKLSQDSTRQRPPLPPPSAAEDSAGEPSASGGGSRLISVRPRDPPGSRAAASSVSSNDDQLDERRRPVTLVRPTANQDEWDVVRELSRRPDSDTRALLGTVRREVAQFGVATAAQPQEAESTAAAPIGDEASTAA